jgi:hypothetical protein
LLRTASKFVPVSNSRQKQQRTQGITRKPMNQRFYTLCEVDNAERQVLPPVVNTS